MNSNQKNNVYFLDSKGNERVIGQADTQEEVFAVINKFLDDHKFKSYYTNIYLNKSTNRMRYDVGSHTEFFESDLILKLEGN